MILSVVISILLSIESLLNSFDTAKANEKFVLADSVSRYMVEDEFLDGPIYQLGDEISNDSLCFLIYYWASEYMYAKSDFHSAERYGMRALPYGKRLGNLGNLSDNLSIIGISCLRQSKYEDAIRYLNQCYDIDKELGDKSRISSDLNSIAAVYYTAKRPKEAEKYIKEAIEINAEIGDKKRMAVLYGTLSEIENSLGNYKDALCSAGKALKIEEDLNRVDKIGVRLSQMAFAYMGLEQYDDALRSLNRALPLLEESGNSHSVAICYKQLGDIMVNKDSLLLAAEYYSNALELFKQQGDTYNQCSTERGLYVALRGSDVVRAMQHLERADKLSTELYSQQTGQMISEYNAQLGNDLLQSKIAMNDRARVRWLLFGIVSFIVLLLIIISLWIVMHRNIKKGREKYKELEGLYTDVIQGKSREEENLSEDDKQFLTKVINIVNDRLEEGKIDVEMVASDLCMSTSQFRRRLNSLTGESPKTYIMYISMQKAKYMLSQHTDMPISEIATLCGYEEPSSFIHAFRKLVGCTPNQYRKNDKLQDVEQNC